MIIRIPNTTTFIETENVATYDYYPPGASRPAQHGGYDQYKDEHALVVVTTAPDGVVDPDGVVRPRPYKRDIIGDPAQALLTILDKLDLG